MSYIKVNIGGTERGLSFKMGTLRHIGELTANDPLVFANSNGLAGQYGFFKTIVHAGLLANCDAKGVEPDFTDADVTRWVDDIDAAEASRIIGEFTKAYSVPGQEAQGDPRS